MGKRIAAVVLIFACTTVAWMILGATVFSRTYSYDDELKGRVASTWGMPQVQLAPKAYYVKLVPHTEYVRESGKTQPVAHTTQTEVNVPVAIDSSRINVGFDLEHRQKGLLWYSTYTVDFAGTYTFVNPTEQDQTIQMRFYYPSQKTIYDNLQVKVNGQPAKLSEAEADIATSALVPAGKSAEFAVSYRSQGLDNWLYKFGDDVTEVKNFAMHMTTNFDAIDFPNDTLSPTDKNQMGGGWELNWRYKDLVSGYQLGMQMPEKLQPGPLAGQISLFAPVSLFFFFFLMFIITTLRGIELHPMNYFFLAGAFFAFHLLLAYTVDHISIHLAFAIASAVSIFLVVSYLRLVVGLRFAAVEAGMSQFVYLVLFSYAFFFKGFTGLAVTIGSIVTLFVVMQLTGRIKWAEQFAKPPLPAPVRS